MAHLNGSNLVGIDYMIKNPFRETQNSLYKLTKKNYGSHKRSLVTLMN